ncbi:adenylate kinase family protein [Candidatus Nanohalovita haloferacivicina]|uniref:adenylate kinase family protein n=1 Tax=Candidatus Nanohalovita haloferacivicina TaxID=2978046 RepID=UPI00325FBD3D|nr:Adenylate kinase [Candidatus Nanohalobia archaeon BNXNv]
MKITITGTPGTGKTTVSDNLDIPVIHLTEFVKEKGLGEQKEEFEVDIPAMVEALEEETDDYEDVVIEGHLAHYYPSDLCIVLRCDPEVLDERLEEREYSEAKVRENLESEALDIVLAQAIENQETVIEIDTTNLSREEVIEKMEEKIEKWPEVESDYGKVDWSEWL